MPLKSETRRILVVQYRDEAEDALSPPELRLTAAVNWARMALTEAIPQVPQALAIAGPLLEFSPAEERLKHATAIAFARAEYCYFMGDFAGVDSAAADVERWVGKPLDQSSASLWAMAKRYRGLARAETLGADRALEDYFEALDQLRHVGDDTVAEELVVLAAIGSAYGALSLLNDAIDVFEEAQQLLPEVHDAYATFVVNSNAITVYRDLHRFSDAIRCGEAALDIAASQGASRWRAVASARLATVHLELGSIELAHELLNTALRLGTEIGYASFIPWVHFRIARVFLKEGKLDQARAHAEAARDSRDAQALTELQRQAFEVLSTICAQTGDTAAELENQRALLALERKLFGAETRKRLLDFSVKRAAARAQRRTVELEARIVHAQRDMEQAQYETLERLAIAAEARDHDTAEHTYRVGHMAAAIAAEMNLPQDMVERIRFAARLHDIGKIGIPDHIMLKAGPLSDSEFEVVKTHTTIGARILADGRSDLMRMAEAVAQSHHECWGGGGYPQGLVGEAIPLAGRITTVADVFDALTHSRPYKTAWETQRAIDEIRFLSGKKFQPEVVDAFLRVVTKHPDFLTSLALLRVA